MVRRGVAPPRPTLRVRAAFRAGLAIVRFFADAGALRVVARVAVFAVTAVLFDLRAVAVFAFTAFALAFGRVSTLGDASAADLLSADASV